MAVLSNIAARLQSIPKDNEPIYLMPIAVGLTIASKSVFIYERMWYRGLDGGRTDRHTILIIMGYRLIGD